MILLKRLIFLVFHLEGLEMIAFLIDHVCVTGDGMSWLSVYLVLRPLYVLLRVEMFQVLRI